MKKANRILALVMALVLVLGLATTVSAAGTSSITITATTTNHHYEAYQIFKGDLNGAGTQQDPYVLSNIVWGNGIDEEGKAAFGDAADKAASIKTAEDAKVFALDVKGYLTAPSAFTQNGTTYTLTGLDAGYYLVKDKDNTQDIENGSYTAFIMKVAGAVTATAKDGVPTATKYVRDENDSDYNETNNWQDSADYEIGDAVPFKVEATLADNVSAFKGPYKLVFDDTMGAGLTYNGDITITLDETLIYDATPEEGFTNKTGITVSYENGKLVVTMNDAKDLGATDESVIVLEYTATLNEQANLYITGNTNKVALKYANDPNWQLPTDGTNPPPPSGETPESVVVVFTYQLIVDKVELNPNYDAAKDPDNDGVDSENQNKYKPLPGAGFTLYKEYATGENTTEWRAVGEELTGAALTEFVWSGLDDGNYKLVETTVPAGYNKAADVLFTITATHDLEGATNTLTLAGDGLVLDSEGNLTTEIVNKPGVVLPGTGGMGTTLFYAIGGVLVLAAIVLLVSKKRMASAE